ncbi:MAG TPA: alpha/beta fold hydrolase [Chloroflexia bacterium]|nr:alpha/beta fold hydrolase [Chloroflexia bacterium]
MGRPGQKKRKGDASRFVDVKGVRVRYMEEGREQGGTPLLIVHGYNGSCDYWYPHTVPALGLERWVIALDLPGNGLSGKLQRHTLESYAEFIIDLIDALGLEKIDLMGHSMGGMIGIAAATNHPERFRKLVLVDSAGLPELVKRPWLAPILMLGDSSLRQVRYYPTFIKIGLRARTPREGLRMIRTESVGEMLSRLTVPTLIVWGSNDRVVPLEHGAHMAQHIPGARLAIIRGAGHMPFYEKPRECNRIVLSFLRGGE